MRLTHKKQEVTKPGYLEFFLGVGLDIGGGVPDLILVPLCTSDADKKTWNKPDVNITRIGKQIPAAHSHTYHYAPHYHDVNHQIHGHCGVCGLAVVCTGSATYLIGDIQIDFFILSFSASP